MWAGNPSSYSSYSDAKESRLQWIWIEVLMEKDPQQDLFMEVYGSFSLCRILLGGELPRCRIPEIPPRTS